VLSNYPGDIYGQVIGKSNEGSWLPNASYTLGTYRMPVNPPLTNRFRYEVTTAGVTGDAEPVWPTAINATVTDGSVVWTCRDSRFLNGDYATVFAQAKAIGMRYIEPWEWEFKYGPNSADGEWDAVLADFNAWADATYGNTPRAIVDITILGQSTIELTWPTATGFGYQVEWSPDLDQWFAVDDPAPGTGADMTWTDDGSQTDSPPFAQHRRFYRIRIS
jgi:hypothetical protein